MTEADRLERDLATWLDDTAVPSVPDYVSDIVREATRHRQRPRWTFVGRWWPTATARPAVPRGTRVALSALLLLLALALALVAIAVVGSQARLPAPFGPANNGLLAFARDGDIFTFDPLSGVERAIVTGPDLDHDPRWSLDGGHIAFVRDSGVAAHLVVVDADGGHPVVSQNEFYDLDTDSIAWSPGGTSIAIGAVDGVRRSIYIVNTTDGRVVPTTSEYLEGEVFWRPPDGRQLLFKGSSGARFGLSVLSLDDGSVENVPTSAVLGDDLRALGWTLDGQRIAFQGTRAFGPYTVVLLDMVTALETPLDLSFAHVSNDGSMLVGMSTLVEEPQVCVRLIDADPCTLLGSELQAPEYTTGAGLQWSPNDRWITTFAERPRLIWLLSRDGAGPAISIPADGPASWQRKALSEAFPSP